MVELGERFQPAFKPDWSADLLLCCNYIGRLAMIRTATAIEAGGFRDGFGRAYRWELLFRLYDRAGVSSASSRVSIIAKIQPWAPGPTSVTPCCSIRESIPGLALGVDGPLDASRLHWRVEQALTVSVILPTTKRSLC